MLRAKAIRASSSTASTRASPTTCCRWRWPAPARASSRSAAWRSSNYATYDSATVMFDVMGFGKPIDEIPMLLQPGVLSIGVGFGGAATRRGPGPRTRRPRGDLRPRARTGGLRHRQRTHRQGHRRRPAIRGDRSGRRRTRRGARARHPAARRPVPGVAATGTARRQLPHRDHRRTVATPWTSA